MRRALRPAILATLGYTLITVVWYWHGVRHMAGSYISDGADGAAFLWSYWHIPRALLDLENPFSATDIFYPVGTRLGFHTTTPLQAVLSWPLSKILGPVLAINLLNLGAVVLTGLGGWVLARHECHDDRAAFVAGAGFMLVPQHVGRIMGHWNFNHAWVLPFALWAVLRVYDKPTWKRAGVLGVLAGVVFLTDLTLFVFWLLASLLIALWRRRETMQIVAKLSGAGAVAAVLSAPVALPMLMDLRHRELDPLPQFGGANEHSADLLGFFTPSVLHPFWGGLFDSVHPNVFGLEEYPYAGIMVLTLALLAVLTRRRHGPVGPWLMLSGVFMVLALGPYLHVNGKTGAAFSKFGFEYTVPLPYFVFHQIPVLSGLRIPGRFALMGALALNVAAAVTLARFVRERSWRWQWAVPALALLIALVELLPFARVPLQPDEAPPAYAAIKRHADDSAVLEIPLVWRDGFGQVGDQANHDVFLYWATVHERPVVSGMVARLSRQRRAALYSFPVLRQVLALQKQPGFTDTIEFGPNELRAMGIGFVVYHRSRPEPDVLMYVESLGLEKIADDGDTVVWHVP